jgi:dinuclear metal center YbgI/SA1388 family protein
MHYQVLVEKLNQLLKINDWRETDNSQNGLQIQPSAAHSEVKKIAFTVDANLQTFKLAAKQPDIDLLFVHHGLFWGDSPLPVGSHYQRLKTIFDAGIGLYACHLPLDAHPTLGNNAELARLLKLTKLQPLDVGLIGVLPQHLTIPQVIAKLALPVDHHLHILPFGSQQISRVAIISGGGGHPKYLDLAASAGAQLYITGELGHLSYQSAQELKLNVLGLGHYWTETFGPQAVRAYVSQKFSLETEWLDAPTNF